MPILHAILLGIIQGITEFLPISSTAHLWLVPWLLGWPDQGLAFDIAMHVGTLAAVILYFFRDWLQVIAQGFGFDYGGDPGLKQNPKLLWLLAAATIPVGVAGYLFKKQAETTWRSPYVIAATMISVGLVLWWAERAGRKQKDLAVLMPADAMKIGAAQALAIVPGVSRSGITISAGLFQNLNRPAAARFSFLLSAPAIAGAAGKDLWDLMKHQGGIPPEMRMVFLVGIVASAVTGCLVIHFFLNFLRRRSLAFFVYYRVVFGIIIIALATIFRTGG
ncbi:MAG: undecaprenyl-diphosphatase UppP [Acidobacteria bacterium]|jgi:undecaprenyl-diphosphatase|nr:MAG: undecaprenyl-diphosphatase UppP [Acidobacteriota bacterium]